MNSKVINEVKKYFDRLNKLATANEQYKKYFDTIKMFDEKMKINFSGEFLNGLGFHEVKTAELDKKTVKETGDGEPINYKNDYVIYQEMEYYNITNEDFKYWIENSDLIECIIEELAKCLKVEQIEEFIKLLKEC